MLQSLKSAYNNSRISEIANSIYDLAHHLKYSFNAKNASSDRLRLQYYLTKHYHIIEKGLALPSPKPGFGQPKILNILKMAKLYEDTYGEDKLILSINKALIAYLDFHKDKGYKLPTDFHSTLTSYLGRKDLSPATAEGGLKLKSKNSLLNLDLQSFNDFVKGRHSVRDFSSEEVSNEILASIISIAQYTPSVCNRQAWRAHCYSNPNQIKKILAMQNGNTGFTDSINKLIIVTGDAKGFSKNESNQIYIDGGMFSMSLLYAIHSAGLGACPLNTCVYFKQELKIKSIANIPPNERVIMMIAVGSLKDRFQVAYSARNPLNQVLIEH